MNVRSVALIMLVMLTGCAPTSIIPGTPAAARQSAAPLRDGNLTFAVTAVEQRDVVGDPTDPGYSITAEGVFVVVTLEIDNVGDQPVTFVDSAQTLVDATGRFFPTDRAANIYGNRDVRSTRMAPGADLRVRLAFDVPAGTQPREIVLRESAASNGVAVALE